MSSLKKIPSPLVSLLPIALLVGMLFATIHTFGSDALGGGSQISLLTTTAFCVFIGIAFYRVPWKDYELAITNNIAGVATAIIILLIIGALSGAWMISGIVPTLIYYGMQIIHPDFFLASTCIICALISVMTGSSWTTIATIGIALMGIGKAQGFNEGWIAGAIISGAYFGDKISPLSETTILASSITDVPLFRHIRYMLITTTPSLIITLVIFTVMGFVIETHSTEHMADFAVSLKDTFNITPWLLIVPIVTGILIARKTPSIITLFLSTLLAGICAIIFQPELLREIAGESNIFKGVMMTFYGSTSLDTGNTMLTDLVSTRGMAGMMDTVWLILCAICFNSVVFPVFGGDTIIPRCPFPTGDNRSTIRIGMDDLSVSIPNLSLGKIGVRSSKCCLLAAISGLYPLTDSTNNKALNFSLWVLIRIAPVKMSPVFKLNLRI